MSKSATKEGTTRYAQKFAGRAAGGHFRETQRLALSSIGLGTYLGQPDQKTDERYTAAVAKAVESGLNVIDQRHQLPLPEERTKHRRGASAACRKRYRARGNCVVHEGRLPVAGWRYACRSE